MCVCIYICVCVCMCVCVCVCVCRILKIKTTTNTLDTEKWYSECDCPSSDLFACSSQQVDEMTGIHYEVWHVLRDQFPVLHQRRAPVYGWCQSYSKPLEIAHRNITCINLRTVLCSFYIITIIIFLESK